MNKKIYINKLYERKSKGRPYLYLHIPSAIVNELGLTGDGRVNIWLGDGGKILIEKSFRKASELPLDGGK